MAWAAVYAAPFLFWRRSLVGALAEANITRQG